MTLYFHISIFRHNFCSCPVRLVLSYCIQTSFKTHLIPRHTSSQHPSSSTSSTHNPHSMPPPLLQCYQGLAKMPPRPQIQKSGTCTLYVLLLLLLLPVCLPTCTHPPTFASPNAAFATSAPSVGSAKSPHGCLCHLTPIHSQVSSDATGVATLGGERWTCLEQACSGPMERLRRLEAAAAAQHHCNTRWRTFALLFFSVFFFAWGWSGKTMGLFVLARH